MSIPAASDNEILPGEYKGSTPTSSVYASDENIPANLRRSAHRLQFPPSYVVVGFYRLLSDPNLRVPAWNKCKHGFVRGATVGLVWVSMVHRMLEEDECMLMSSRQWERIRYRRCSWSTSSLSEYCTLNSTLYRLLVWVALS